MSLSKATDENHAYMLNSKKCIGNVETRVDAHRVRIAFLRIEIF